jgi:HSP20 family protein
MANIIRKSEGALAPGASLDPFEVMREMLHWDPLRQLLGGGALQQVPSQLFTPHFEVKETPDAYVFKADLPGVQEKDLEITLSQGRLSVSGRRDMEKREENERFYTVERSYGSFTRTFTLPSDIDEARVEAELRDGVLALRVPKSAEQQPKKIALKSAGGGGAKGAKATVA